MNTFKTAFRVGDTVAHKDYPSKCGRVTKVGRLIPRDHNDRQVMYTVKWSTHPGGESRHFEEALKVVIKKL